MLTIRLTSLTAATALALAMAASIEAPAADAFVQQTDAPLLGASLNASQEITIAQNDGRRGGRGDGARGGRGGGDGARGGRGGRGEGARGGRGGSDGAARGGRGPRAGGAVLPNESGGMRTATPPGRGDRGGRGAGGGRGGNDDGFRGGRGGRGDGYRGGRGGRGDGYRGSGGGRDTGYRGGRGGRNDGYRGGRGSRTDVYRGTRGGRGDAYRDGWRDGRTGTRSGIRDQRYGRGDAYRRGIHDGRGARINRHGGYRGGHTFRDSRGSYRRGYVNGRIDARRYYSSYHRPARASWRYHARYYDAGHNRYTYNYYDRGCRANGDQVLAGAILGALFGAAVADDGAAGAVIGGFFGAGVGSALNSCDRGQLHYAVGYAFTHNSPYYWHNPYSGVRGVVYARDYYTVGNRRCRWGDAEIYMPDGSFVIDEVRMCQDAYGRWQVASYQ
ncbi:hypothetical protein [Hyphobacterium indicum]|uniref:hypothetical protein n=1 Tax=Hyphobacterium indicum TaxID=2162714 RepID=UPI000D65B9C3|nr:hypothetical protein [Hyphobacterium indicum]